MDDAAASRIAHGALALMNPMPDAATDEAIDLLGLAPGSRVLEVVCDRAEVRGLA